MSKTEPAYVPGLVKLLARSAVGDEFTRIQLGGECLANLAEHGLDQRIKLIIPFSQPPRATVLLDDPDNWYANWRALEDSLREPIRTYTVLNPCADSQTMDVLVANHQPAGVVGNWLADAVIGDELIAVFPNRLSPNSEIGIDWHPGSARQVLLIGDVTAIPAIKGILDSIAETTDQNISGLAVIESLVAPQELGLDHSNVQIVWLQSTEGVAPGTLLMQWVAEHFQKEFSKADLAADDELVWDSPDAENRRDYLWCAAEAGVVKTIRRIVKDSGTYRKQDCAFMGYWKQGVAG